MTVPADKTYPATATNDAWQKKKSVADKALAKTGLGADLKDAEKKWNAVPWKDLDAHALAAKTVAAAQGQLQTAKAANTQIQAAKTALTKAKGGALNAAANKSLSKTAQAAASAIANDLTGALTRLQSIKTTDFDQAIQRLEAAAIVQINKISVQYGGEVVATATNGTWDRKELKVVGVVWKVGKADDYKGKTLTVHGEPALTSGIAEGISKVFQNDMKIVSASGSAATFKP